MSAYMIFVRSKMNDQEKYSDYLQKGAPLVKKYGGEILVLNGAHESLEGQVIDGTVVLKFPDMAAARSFYNSEEYSLVKSLRLSATEGLAVLVDGFPG